jgi:hypothetical protein
MHIINLQLIVDRVFGCVRKIAKSDYWLRYGCPVRPSVRRAQLGSHWTDFQEI